MFYYEKRPETQLKDKAHRSFSGFPGKRNRPPQDRCRPIKSIKTANKLLRSDANYLLQLCGVALAAIGTHVRSEIYS